MGLDQYIYRCRKIGKKALLQLNGKRKSEIDWHEYMVLHKDRVDKRHEMYGDLMDILQPIKLVKTSIDMYRIRENHDVPAHYEIGYRSEGDGQITWSFYGDPEEKPVIVSLTDNELKPYTYDQLTDYYICRSKEVYYMRKEYEVQDSIYELYDGTIENCGYHHMSENMIDVVNECAGKKVLDPAATNLFYHEWY